MGTNINAAKRYKDINLPFICPLNNRSFNSTKYCASKIWEKDENKIELAKSNGYEVLVVWDSEYRKNPKQTVEKCIEFLNN